MDRIAATLNEKVIAQTGVQTEKWVHLEKVEELTPENFEKHMSDARLVVSHVGAGTILTAQRLQKPLVVFPRRAELSEHRNDHQIDSAHRLDNIEGVYVAWTETQLEQYVRRNDLVPTGSSDSLARVQLVDRLKLFIDG